MDQRSIVNVCSVPGTEQNNFTKSVLDLEVSRYDNYRSPANPATISLLDLLTSAEHKQDVELIRSVSDKKVRDNLKSKLPATTPSGLFSYKNENSIIRHSGLLQFDIDLKENTNIRNFYS